MDLLKNLRLNEYFMAIVYMSFIILVGSIFYKETAFLSNELIGRVSTIWLIIGIFLWLTNDVLDLLGKRTDLEHKKGNSVFLDRLGIKWTYAVIFMHFFVLIIGIYLSWKAVTIHS